MKELTNSQKVFCREYIYDWNGTRAYKVAYPGIKNDSVAAVNASRLLRNANISDHIELIQRDLEKLAGISRLMIANEFRKIGFSSIANLHNTWIERKEFEALTQDQKEAIQEIETKVIKQKNYLASTPDFPIFDDVEYVKIKLFDKNKALENLNKMLGYNEAEKRDITVTTNEIPQISISFRDAD